MQILKWQILILGIGFFGSCILYAVLYIQAEQRKDRENAPPTELFIRTRTGEPVCPYCARTDQIRQYQYGLTREAPPEGMISGVVEWAQTVLNINAWLAVLASEKPPTSITKISSQKMKNRFRCKLTGFR